MDGKYTFERFEQELDEGYQLYYTYVRNRYLLFKTNENCYTQKLLSVHSKNPQPVMSMLTKKRVKEMCICVNDVKQNLKKIVVSLN